MALSRRWMRRAGAAAGAAALVGGGYVLLGPAAPGLIDHMADGQRVWRLGTIEIEGVSGTWLGDLRAERATLADADGVWLEARDLALSWRPQDLLLGGLRLDVARAANITLLRQPALSEPRPSSGAGVHVRIGALDIDELRIEEPAFGEAGVFRASLGLDLAGEDLRLLALDLRRTDSDADRALIAYRPDGDYQL
ncbi:MAG: hypothetical protein JNK94_08905, partial [Hyphomonadaceae bacterium]|nr:hypothetical protein [Hyphomonadaceae bacterium]